MVIDTLKNRDKFQRIHIEWNNHLEEIPNCRNGTYNVESKYQTVKWYLETEDSVDIGFNIHYNKKIAENLKII